MIKGKGLEKSRGECPCLVLRHCTILSAQVSLSAQVGTPSRFTEYLPVHRVHSVHLCTVHAVPSCIQDLKSNGTVLQCCESGMIFSGYGYDFLEFQIRIRLRFLEFRILNPTHDI